MQTAAEFSVSSPQSWVGVRMVAGPVLIFNLLISVALIGLCRRRRWWWGGVGVVWSVLTLNIVCDVGQQTHTGAQCGSAAGAVTFTGLVIATFASCLLGQPHSQEVMR